MNEDTSTSLSPNQPEQNQEESDELSDEGRARKRQEQADARARGRAGRKGLVIVNTGNGKGKTTAALGLLMRCWGQDMRVVMLQFLKAKTGKWGEIRAAQRMGVEITPLGKGFSWMSENIEQDRAVAQACWQQCREKIESGLYDIVVMDEITYPLKYGWLSLAEVITVLRQRDPMLHIVITGRDAPQELIEYADMVTEMREIKHPYKLQGIRAQKGIEF
ncbi:MAG: cob(I)yrinic acid a,c-diamide adenosyltransferase [Ktedonobacteraceae bacterium]